MEDRYRLLMLLWLASESNERGTIDLDSEDIALTLEIEEAEYLVLERRFCKKGILERVEEGLAVCNWAEYQYDKPSDSREATRERKRRQREKEQDMMSRDVTPHVTPMSRDVTPYVTPPDQNRLDQNRAEAEAEGGTGETTLSIVEDAPPPASPFWERNEEGAEVGEVSGVFRVPDPPPPRLPKSTNPMKPPAWWCELTAEGWLPEEIAKAREIAVEKRGKDPAEKGFVQYLRAILPDVRAQCDATRPPPQADPFEERRQREEQKRKEEAEREKRRAERAAKVEADLAEWSRKREQLSKTS